MTFDEAEKGALSLKGLFTSLLRDFARKNNTYYCPFKQHLTQRTDILHIVFQVTWPWSIYNFVKPYFKVDRNTFKGLHLIPEWNVTFFHFGLAYHYSSTFVIKPK